MTHNLKTLYQHHQARNPDLIAQFQHLELYCTAETDAEHDRIRRLMLHTGYGSLKWFIYRLRYEIQQKQIETLFHHLLLEALEQQGEGALYGGIKHFFAAELYWPKTGNPRFNIEEWPIININGLRTLINTTRESISYQVFRDDLADLIIIRNDLSHAVININLRAVARTEGWEQLHTALLDTGELWNAPKPNIYLCGGPKRPKETTALTTNDLIELCKLNLSVKHSTPNPTPNQN